MKFAKAVMSSALMLLIATSTLDFSGHSVVEAKKKKKDDPLGHTGIAMRVEQNSLNQFKSAMGRFLPDFIMFDLGLPESKQYNLWALFGLIDYTFTWTEITYENPSFDLVDTTINFHNTFGFEVLKMNFPTLKEWKIHANQHVNSFFAPKSSPVYFEFKDFDFMLNLNFDRKDNGYLHPNVMSTDIKFGESFFYHDDWVQAVIWHQTIKYALVIIQNSVYFAGQHIFNGMLEPVMTKYLNYYQLEVVLPSPFKGQWSEDVFTFDLRHTEQPFIGENYMDMFIYGAVSYNGFKCEPFKNDAPFLIDVHDHSQVVVTQEAASCMANQWANSQIGKVFLNTQTFNELFGTNIELTTTLLKEELQLGIFEDLLGKDKKLKMLVGFKDIEVEFGPDEDVNVILKYTATFSLALDLLGTKEVVYDEIRMYSAANVQAQNDDLHIQLLEHKLDVGSELAQKTRPHRTSMDITENDYIEFLQDFSFANDYVMKWLNDVIFRNNKVSFPYTMEEFETNLVFGDKQVHIMIAIMDGMDVLLEVLEQNFRDKKNNSKVERVQNLMDSKRELD